MRAPTVGALFAGYGGLECALHDVFDAEPAWFSEVDAAPSRILAHHWPDVPNLGDITKVRWEDVEPVDIITGGSPCQDLSHAGKRAGMRAGTRSGLWASMCDAIDILRPSLVVWENVRGALSATADSAVEPCPICVGDGRGVTLRALGRVLGDLAELGYDAAWTGLRAADVGAPHGRFRVFVLAWPAADTDGLGRGWSEREAVAAQATQLRTPGHSAPPAWGSPEWRDLTLLPSPRTSDTNGAGAHGQGGLDLRTAVSLLPTPTTRDGKGRNQRDDDTCLTGALLPTPRATDGTKGGPNQRGSSGDLMLPSAVQHLLPTPAVNDAQKRILDRVEGEPESGCWLWTGWTNRAATPYGRVSIDGRKVYAHRAAYEAFVGPIPDGHEIDHLCQSSLCVNPDHLEAVTPEENRDRVTQRRTHCKRGHEFTEENTYWVRPGARACRACRAWQDKVDKARRKGEEIPLLPTPAPDTWDQWTDRMKAAHGNGNGHGASLHIEALRMLPTPTSMDAHASGGGYNGQTNVTLTDATVRKPADFGQYAPAIARWEAVLGRPAPAPTEPTGKGGAHRLSPAFVEFMMGLPAGHVTAVPGISRNDQLKALGNGVVPAQAAAAVRHLLTIRASEAAA